MIDPEQLKELLALKTAKNKADGIFLSEFAAQLDVEAVLHLIASQPMHAAQLLAEELEDARKSVAKLTS